VSRSSVGSDQKWQVSVVPFFCYWVLNVLFVKSVHDGKSELLACSLTFKCMIIYIIIIILLLLLFSIIIIIYIIIYNEDVGIFNIVYLYKMSFNYILFDISYLLQYDTLILLLFIIFISTQMPTFDTC